MIAMSGPGHARPIPTRLERELVAPWPPKLSMKKRLSPGYLDNWWVMVDSALASRDLLRHVLSAPNTHEDISAANPLASPVEVQEVFAIAKNTRSMALANAARSLFALADHNEIGMSDTRRVQQWVSVGDGGAIYNYLKELTDTKSYVLQKEIRQAYADVAVTPTDSHVVLREKLELKAYLFQLNTNFNVASDAWQGAMDICDMTITMACGRLLKILHLPRPWFTSYVMFVFFNRWWNAVRSRCFRLMVASIRLMLSLSISIRYLARCTTYL